MNYIHKLAILPVLGLALIGVLTGPAHAQDNDTNKAVELKPISIGDEDAPVRIDEYASLTCSHCAKFHNSVLPELKDAYIDTGKVRLVVHAYPLNEPALDASMIVQCMPEERANSFMNLLFENQKKWAQKDDYRQALKQNAKLAGMSNDRAEQCFNNKDLRQSIVSNMQQVSQKMDISSTPTFVINDGAERIVGARSMEVFADTIDTLLETAEKTNNDDD